MKSTKKTIPVGLPDLALVITCLCWGLNFVITKSATGENPEHFRLFIYNIIRFPVASGLLFLTLYLKGESVLLGKKYFVGTALISFVGIFMYQTLYMIGQSLTGSAKIGMVYSFAPLLILVISVIAKVERLSFFTTSGVVVGCFGLFMILFQEGSFTVDKGSLLMLIAIGCWACYVVFGKRILDKYPPMLTTAWMLLFGSLYQVPLALWQLPDQQWAELSGMNIFFVSLSAVMSLYTGYTLFFYSVAKIGPAKAGVYTNLTPVFTVIFASLIRNETILLIHVIGLTVIILGIGITKIPPRSQSKGAAS